MCRISRFCTLIYDDCSACHHLATLPSLPCAVRYVTSTVNLPQSCIGDDFLFVVYVFSSSFEVALLLAHIDCTSSVCPLPTPDSRIKSCRKPKIDMKFTCVRCNLQTWLEVRRSSSQDQMSLPFYIVQSLKTQCH